MVIKYFHILLVGRASFRTANEIISLTLISRVRLRQKEQRAACTEDTRQEHKKCFSTIGITSTDIICLSLLHLILQDSVKLKK